MALTLLEAAKRGTGDVVRDAVIRVWAEAHDFLGALPFEDIPGNAVKFNQEGTLASTAWRPVNGSYTATESTLNPVTEPLLIAGGEVKIDPFIIRTMPGNAEAQRAMKLKALAHDVAVKLIKGDNIASSHEPDGLQARIPTTSSQAVLNNGASDALSIGKLDEAIDKTANPTAILMTMELRRRLTKYLRDNAAGGFRYIVDDFGRQVMEYNGLPILLADRPEYPSSAMPTDEGGGSNRVSIYVVSFAAGYFTGIQNGGIQTRMIGEMETDVKNLDRVEWYVGWSQWHPRSVTRLHTIDPTIAAVA